MKQLGQKKQHIVEGHQGCSTCQPETKGGKALERRRAEQEITEQIEGEVPVRRSIRDSKQIAAAAIMYKGVLYTLPPPARHGDIVNYILETTGEPSIGETEHGFVDQDGFFLRRKPAMIVAERAGQILKNDAPVLSSLFSENLW